VTLEAIFWRFGAGSPWRDGPDEFGAWQSIWKRRRRWSIDGTYEAMFCAVHAVRDVDDEALAAPVWIDSTSVLAHQHAAGAPAVRSTGAESNYTVAGEPTDHALGRSRRRWTTKIHALIDGTCAPVALLLTTGHAGDNP